jgi:methionyl-tRNA formyltransferase
VSGPERVSTAGARIALLCATRRGIRFLERLIRIAPEAQLVVVSFREEPGEPAFFDEIRSIASAHGAEFLEARQVGSARHQAVWERPLDILLAVSWRYMVPPRVYERPRRGSFVIHDSLLPAYRGFAPTVWAIVNGEDKTGATLIEMVSAVDAGSIIDQRQVPIGVDDTIGDVMDRVTDTYLELLEANLDGLLAGTAPRREQDQSKASYTCRRVAADGLIDWQAPARTIHNLIRAHTKPYWGAFTTFESRPLRVWKSRMVVSPLPYVGRIPGRVIEVRPGEGSIVLTGDGAILLTDVELDGSIVDAATVLNSLGHTLGR